MKKETIQLTALTAGIGLVVVALLTFGWLHSLAQPNQFDSQEKTDCAGWYECVWYNQKTPEFLRKMILDRTEYFGLDSTVDETAPVLKYVDPKSVGGNAWTTFDEKLLDELDTVCDLTNESSYVTYKGAGFVFSFDSNGAYGGSEKVRVCDVQNKRLVPRSTQPVVDWGYSDLFVFKEHNALTLAVSGKDTEVLGFTTLQRSLNEGSEDKCNYRLSNVSFNTGSVVTKVSKFQRPCSMGDELKPSEFPDLKDTQFDAEKIANAAKFIDAHRMGVADLDLATKIANKGGAGKSILADSIVSNFPFDQKIESMSDVRHFHKKIDEWRKYVSALAPYLNLPSEYDLPKIEEAASALGTAILNAPSEYAMNEARVLAEKTKGYRVIVLNQEPQLNLYPGGSIAYYGFLAYSSPPEAVVVVSDKNLFSGRGISSVTGYKIGETNVTYDGFKRDAIIIKSLSDEEFEALRGFNSFRQNISKLADKCRELSVWVRSLNNKIVEVNQPMAVPQ